MSTARSEVFRLQYKHSRSPVRCELPVKGHSLAPTHSRNTAQWKSCTAAQHTTLWLSTATHLHLGTNHSTNALKTHLGRLVRPVHQCDEYRPAMKSIHQYPPPRTPLCHPQNMRSQSGSHQPRFSAFSAHLAASGCTAEGAFGKHTFLGDSTLEELRSSTAHAQHTTICTCSQPHIAKQSQPGSKNATAVLIASSKVQRFQRTLSRQRVQAVLHVALHHCQPYAGVCGLHCPHTATQQLQLVLHGTCQHNICVSTAHVSTRGDMPALSAYGVPASQQLQLVLHGTCQHNTCVSTAHVSTRGDMPALSAYGVPASQQLQLVLQAHASTGTCQQEGWHVSIVGWLSASSCCTANVSTGVDISAHANTWGVSSAAA